MIEKQLQNIEEWAASNILQAENLRDQWRKHAAVTTKHLKAISKILQGQNLEISDCRAKKTGNLSYVWGDGDSLTCDIKAVPSNGKFRFLKFQGYDAAGNGKNQKALQEKAKKLEEVFADAGFEVQVNPVSLESKEGTSRAVLSKTDRVLISFFGVKSTSR